MLYVVVVFGAGVEVSPSLFPRPLDLPQGAALEAEARRVPGPSSVGRGAGTC